MADKYISWMLIALLLGVLIYFLYLTRQQYQLVEDVINRYQDLPDGDEKITSIVASFDKTLATLVGFVTAVATGILGYLGGSQGKAEAKKDADQAKGALNEVTTAVASSGTPIPQATMNEIEQKFPRAFGKV